MPVDGQTRHYTWDDVVCLILKDMGLDPTDRQHHEMWYTGNFGPPEYPKDECIRVTKYVMDHNARLEEHTRDKL
jgi:hypothetical protein